MANSRMNYNPEKVHSIRFLRGIQIPKDNLTVINCSTQ